MATNLEKSAAKLAEINERLQRGVLYCTHCKSEKPLENFAKHPHTLSGYLNQCKQCTNAAKTALRAERLENCQCPRCGREQDTLGKLCTLCLRVSESWRINEWAKKNGIENLGREKVGRRKGGPRRATDRKGHDWPGWAERDLNRELNGWGFEEFTPKTLPNGAIIPKKWAEDNNYDVETGEFLTSPNDKDDKK